MCGRYSLSVLPAHLTEHFSLQACPDFSVRYNIAPQSTIPIIRWKADVGRVGQLAKWGLIPAWAKDSAIGNKLNNARGETVAEKPSFRSSFAKHRCLIPASGFYEWAVVDGKKHPYYIHPSSPRSLFGFAGLLAAWKSTEGETIVSACIITTEPNEVMLPIHDRMPVILEPDAYNDWLNPENQEIDFLKTFLKPCQSELMRAHQVSSAVNSGKVEGPECIAPLTD